jgi:hypothetical protein
MDVSRFNLSLMAGPQLSILIHEKENPVQFENSDATLINIEDHSPDRLKTSWQFQVMASLEYRLSNRLRICLEPNYKYYIRSVYEQRISGTKNPWSMGISGGLIVSF